MKQKILIEVAITDNKSRKKALTIAVGRSGVTSVTLQGDGKNKIEVIGEGVDAVELTSMLRKKVGYADILNVSAVSDKKEEKKPEEKKVAEPLVYWPPYGNGVPHYQIYQVPNQDPSCTIM